MVAIILMIPAFADTTDETTDMTATVTDTTGTSSTEATTDGMESTAHDAELASIISSTYNITVAEQDVTSLRESGLGYGEITKAYALSSLSGTSVSDITTMRQTMGWGEIAESLGVSVSDLTRSEQVVENSFKHNQDKSKAAKNTDSDKTAKTAKSDGKSKGTTNSKSSGSKTSSQGNSGSSSGHSGGNSGGHGGGHK